MAVVIVLAFHSKILSFNPTAVNKFLSTCLKNTKRGRIWSALFIKINTSSRQSCGLSFDTRSGFREKAKLKLVHWVVVVAQLVKWSLPTPEVRGSNPVIGKNLYRPITLNCIEKTKIKKKRPAMAHFLKKLVHFSPSLNILCFRQRTLTLREVSLYNWSPVLHVWIQLLHNKQIPTYFLFGQIQSC